jgi:hypothetical protein
MPGCRHLFVQAGVWLLRQGTWVEDEDMSGRRDDLKTDRSTARKIRFRQITRDIRSPGASDLAPNTRRDRGPPAQKCGAERVS